MKRRRRVELAEHMSAHPPEDVLHTRAKRSSNIRRPHAKGGITWLTRINQAFMSDWGVYIA